MIKFKINNITMKPRNIPALSAKNNVENSLRLNKRFAETKYTSKPMVIMKWTMGLVLLKKLAIITIFYTFACKYN